MRRLVAALAAASVVSMLFVFPVFAQELTGGCVLQVRSFEGTQASGAKVDEGQANGIIYEGDVGSQSRPFKVDPEGSVDFLFSTAPTVFVNNHWTIYAQGIPVALLSGSDDNPMDVDETGVVELGDIVARLPFKVVGVFYVSGDLWGNNDANHCHGSGYVQLLGDAVGTPIWILAAALLALGGVGILFAVPWSRTWETDPNAGERLHTGPVTDPPPPQA
jgi:hypothetical protein